MKKTIIFSIITAVIVTVLSFSNVSAATCGYTSDGKAIETSIIDCNANNAGSISGMLLKIIDFIAIGVGIAVVGGIAWGGLIYAQSGGDAGKVKEAKQIIINAVIGLVLFFLMYAATNFLVPGGLFRSGGGATPTPSTPRPSPTTGPQRAV